MVHASPTQRVEVMGTVRLPRFAGWACLLTAMAVALLYLNSAAYSAWVATGPPNDFPEAWMHRAFSHLCYAAGAILFGFGAFRVIRRLPRADRLGLVLGLLALVAVVVPRVRQFIQADRCIDAGGRWDGYKFRCVR